MLSDSEFAAYCDRLQLSDAAIQFISTIRSSPPARQVQSSKRSIPVRYVSTKMGWTVHCESLTVEFAAAREYDFYPKVYEFYDQPTKSDLSLVRKSGRNIPKTHVPDFLVLYDDCVVVEDWKSESDLIKLVKEKPELYIKDGSGWRCPLYEEYYAQYNIKYRLRSSVEINPVHLQNLNYMADYLREDCPPVPQLIRDQINQQIQETPGITFDELRTALEAAEIDDAAGAINTMIADRSIFVSWDAFPFSEQRHVRLFENAEAALAYASTIVVGEDYRRPNLVEINSGSKGRWDGNIWNRPEYG